MKGLWARLSGDDAEKKSQRKEEKKAAKERLTMLDAEHKLNIQLKNPDKALVSTMRGEIGEALGPYAVAIRTTLANEAGKNVGNYLSSLKKEHAKILELEAGLVSKTSKFSKVYNAKEKQALVAGEYKAHQQKLREQSAGRRRSRRRRKTKTRKPKTRKRKRLRRKRRSR